MDLSPSVLSPLPALQGALIAGGFFPAWEAWKKKSWGTAAFAASVLLLGIFLHQIAALSPLVAQAIVIIGSNPGSYISAGIGLVLFIWLRRKVAKLALSAPGPAPEYRGDIDRLDQVLKVTVEDVKNLAEKNSRLGTDLSADINRVGDQCDRIITAIAQISEPREAAYRLEKLAPLLERAGKIADQRRVSTARRNTPLAPPDICGELQMAVRGYLREYGPQVTSEFDSAIRNALKNLSHSPNWRGFDDDDAKVFESRADKHRWIEITAKATAMKRFLEKIREQDLAKLTARPDLDPIIDRKTGEPKNWRQGS